MEAELSHRIAALAALKPPRATITDVMNLGRGTALRVESEELAAMRAELADALHGMLTPQDQAPWRAHVTIQNKVEPKEAKALQQQMLARFAPRPLAVRGLALWRYLGGPWEPVKSWTFRG